MADRFFVTRTETDDGPRFWVMDGQTNKVARATKGFKGSKYDGYLKSDEAQRVADVRNRD